MVVIFDVGERSLACGAVVQCPVTELPPVILLPTTFILYVLPLNNVVWGVGGEDRDVIARSGALPPGSARLPPAHLPRAIPRAAAPRRRMHCFCAFPTACYARWAHACAWQHPGMAPSAGAVAPTCPTTPPACCRVTPTTFPLHAPLLMSWLFRQCDDV